ncbi:MAG: AmmeMemoRadiSam system protein A [Gammaproteobacteria bacterium]|nr:AmmeMemoRadiSam system protein A [Gammaproteobacteria bacterium]
MSQFRHSERRSIVLSVEHPYVTLARDAIRHYLATGTLLDVSGRSDDRPAQGVFVSLHDHAAAEGRLRGCVGSIVPSQAGLCAEIVRQAVNAATSDPRFPPIRADDIDDLDVTVYLLEPPVAVDGIDDLDPSRYGVIVESRTGRRGLLLPAIPGIETARQQVEIAKRKALIQANEPVRLFRFGAEILNEESAEQ